MFDHFATLWNKGLISVKLRGYLFVWYTVWTIYLTVKKKCLTKNESYFVNTSEIFRSYCQKQPSRGVLKKKCSENMQQIYRRTPMRKHDFNKVAKQLYWNRTSAWVFSEFLHIFRIPFLWTPLDGCFCIA